MSDGAMTIRERAGRVEAPHQYDRIGEILIPGEDIQRRVAELGAQISRDYAGGVPILVTILRGGVVFLADIIRTLEIDHEIDFMMVSSYGFAETRSSGAVRILADLSMNIEGRDVIIIEDIVDTGLTLSYIREILETRRPSSLRVCALLDKKARRVKDVKVDYIGFEIPDKFVVGYGLDYGERYRNLPHIIAIKEPQER
jgi:hypoxanthine phosphoribosyltransferase